MKVLNRNLALVFVDLAKSVRLDNLMVYFFIHVYHFYARRLGYLKKIQRLILNLTVNRSRPSHCDINIDERFKNLRHNVFEFYYVANGFSEIVFSPFYYDA